ncbi:hypothetical protein E3N88_18395 [Mikania micrantha]|uniref:Uncharacterized protein n=1 Tax=Mikania micrantha TaxID=192012 RepID=A0A5N6NLN9_9ASTR|nr:hypothetical protein E3N88_18395 [Mikania micrantha]
MEAPPPVRRPTTPLAVGAVGEIVVVVVVVSLIPGALLITEEPPPPQTSSAASSSPPSSPHTTASPAADLPVPPPPETSSSAPAGQPPSPPLITYSRRTSSTIPAFNQFTTTQPFSTSQTDSNQPPPNSNRARPSHLRQNRVIPGLKTKLISISQLDEQGLDVNFGSGKWKVIKGNVVIAQGKKQGSLYLQPLLRPHGCHQLGKFRIKEGNLGDEVRLRVNRIHMTR